MKKRLLNFCLCLSIFGLTSCGLISSNNPSDQTENNKPNEETPSDDNSDETPDVEEPSTDDTTDDKDEVEEPGENNQYVPKYTGITVSNLNQRVKKVKNNLEIDDSSNNYFVTPDSEFYIVIHLDNPKQYEILSFTLNDYKYQAFQFEDGSDSNNLVLRMTSESNAGLYEYTVSNIKYVDGDRIKDVDMSSANRTVKVTVSYVDVPTVINEKYYLKYTSFTDTFTILDTYNLGENFKYSVSGDNDFYYVKDIDASTTSVTIDGLRMHGNYYVEITCDYDCLDGNGTQNRVIYSQYISTLFSASINISDVKADSFTYTFSSENEEVELIKADLYQNDELINSSTNSNDTFSGLLSNTYYYIEASYKYGTYEDKVTTTAYTDSYPTPTLNVVTIGSTSDSISFNIEKDDPYNLIEVTDVNLLLDNEVVKTLTTFDALKFSDLKDASLYRIEVNYTIDLKDGYESRKEMAFTYCSTMALPINITRVITDSIINIGRNLTFNVTLSNPSNVTISNLNINGKTYEVKSPASTQLVVDVPNDTFAGNYEYTIDKVGYYINGYYFEQDLEAPYEGNRYVIDNVDITDLSDADGDLIIDINNPEDLNLRLHNDSNYEVESITLRNGTSSSGFEYTLNKDNFEINNNVITFSSDIIKNNFYMGAVTTFAVSSINLKVDDFDYVVKPISEYYSFAFVDKTNAIHVDSYEDLLNPEQISSSYYVLDNDISLKDVDFSSIYFYGVLDGNGYTISNLKSDSTVGLFSSFNGLATNLKIDNFELTCNSNSENFGIFAASARDSVINKVSITNSYLGVTANSGEVYVGGFVGSSYYNSVTKSSISNSTLYLNGNSATMKMGGFLGSDRGGNLKVTDSLFINNNVNIYGTAAWCTLGGFVTEDIGLLKNLISYGNSFDFVTKDQTNFGGIIYYYTDLIQGCFFNNNYLNIDNPTHTPMIIYGDSRIERCYHTDDNEATFQFYNNEKQDGKLIETEKMNDKNTFLEAGFSDYVWNLDNLDYSNGIIPSLK